ncbi:MAG: hypothetical protein D6706_11145 [Chloroflexi bacterium]|nr:MAG: hypothetical protein D6706_11145 [Chloroflexota bacterium]
MIMDDLHDEEELNKLLEMVIVQERPFTSSIPLIGGLIVRFRTAWNNIATRWYMLPILEQQNRVNQLLARSLQDIDARLIAQDREQSMAAQDLAQIVTQIKQMNALLTRIEQRLAALEEKTTNGT